MLSDFRVEFKFGVDTCVSKVYAINALKNKFLVTYNEYFIWIDISECKLYDPSFEGDYDYY